MADVENHVGSVAGNYVGRDSYNNCYFGVKPTRLEMLFRNLLEEYKGNICIQKSIDDIKYYKTVLDGSKGLEEKLRDGGFSDRDIFFSSLKKQKYGKKAEQNRFYESAQKIDSLIFGKIKTNFESEIYPLIKDGQSLDVVIKKINELVIKPMVDEIEQVGANDTILCYSPEDIMGMLYYLTGSCHVNWKDYNAIQAGI